jgi:hypothetical protein
MGAPCRWSRLSAARPGGSLRARDVGARSSASVYPERSRLTITRLGSGGAPQVLERPFLNARERVSRKTAVRVRTPRS